MPFEQSPLPRQGTPSENARLYNSRAVQREGMRDPHAPKSMEELVHESRQKNQEDAGPPEIFEFASTDRPQATSPSPFALQHEEEKAALEARAKAMNRTPGEVLRFEEQEKEQSEIAADQRKIIDDATKRVMEESIAKLTRDELIRSVESAPVTQRVPDTVRPGTDVEEAAPSTIPSAVRTTAEADRVVISGRGTIRTERTPGVQPYEPSSLTPDEVRRQNTGT